MTDLSAIAISQMFDDFLEAKSDGLTRRTARKYAEVLALLEEFLEDHGITAIELGSQGASVLRDTLELIEEFNDEYLVRTIDAERDFLRVASAASRDLSRWLKVRTLKNPPPPATSRTPADPGVSRAQA